MTRQRRLKAIAEARAADLTRIEICEDLELRPLLAEHVNAHFDLLLTPRSRQHSVRLRLINADYAIASYQLRKQHESKMAEIRFDIAENNQIIPCRSDAIH
jgi:hypothetical protein